MEDTRLESFPFDSKQSGYDDYGYPVYDRAVGASMLRQTFAQFFSNGVFDAPSNAFELSKGSGLKVNIAEGIAIINGAMASVPEGGISVALTDESTTVGTYAYGVFLRYDENSDKRSCYITIRKGEAGSSPTPPDPERSEPGIWELRIGYVVVPTGSTNLSNATVTNEKGLANCPFAFPFEEIDLSSVTEDAKASANEALTYLLDYFNKYKDMVDAAVDETLAGQLQTQINQLQEQLNNFDLSGSVDGETVAYGQKPGDSKETLHVPEGGIGTSEIKNGSVTNEKLAEEARSLLTDDPESTADASQYYAATPKCVDLKISLPKGHKAQSIDSTVLNNEGIDFSQFSIEGFSLADNNKSLKANVSLFAFISFTTSYKFDITIRVNGKVALASRATDGRNVFVVFLNKDDIMNISYSGGNAYITYTIIQGM